MEMLWNNCWIWLIVSLFGEDMLHRDLRVRGRVSVRLTPWKKLCECELGDFNLLYSCLPHILMLWAPDWSHRCIKDTLGSGQACWSTSGRPSLEILSEWGISLSALIIRAILPGSGNLWHAMAIWSILNPTNGWHPVDTAWWPAGYWYQEYDITACSIAIGLSLRCLNCLCISIHQASISDEQRETVLWGKPLATRSNIRWFLIRTKCSSQRYLDHRNV